MPPSLLHSSSPHSTLIPRSVYCSLSPSLLSLEVCPSTSGEAGLLSDNRSSVTPLNPRPPLSLSVCRSRSQIAQWGDVSSWRWNKLREGRGITSFIRETMAASHFAACLYSSSFNGNIWKPAVGYTFFCRWIPEAALQLVKPSSRGSLHPSPPPSLIWGTTLWNSETSGMTEILVSDVNLNSVCDRLEQHCFLDQNQQNLSGQPQTPVLTSHNNTGAKLWGRVRSKLLRQKVSDWHVHTHRLSFLLFLSFLLSYLSFCHFHLFALSCSVCSSLCACHHPQGFSL